MKVIVITGTPGTGKTTIARRLHRQIKGSRLVSANEIIKKGKFYRYVSSDGAKVADMQKLSYALRNEASKPGRGTLIIEGHLLSDIKIPGAVAIVLREHLATLKSRLLKRRYPISKIRDNIVDEAIDYCGVHAAQNYKKVYEFMSNDTKIVKKLMDIAAGNYKQRNKQIRLLDELLDIIKEDRRYAI